MHHIFISLVCATICKIITRIAFVARKFHTQKLGSFDWTNLFVRINVDHAYVDI